MDDLHFQIVEGIPSTGGSGRVIYAVEALDDLFSEEFCDERIPDRAVGDNKEDIETE